MELVFADLLSGTEPPPGWPGTGGTAHAKRQEMKQNPPPKALRFEPGKIGWILLWLLGVPIPVLLILFLLRGCT